jgi:SagB-type dehydrogenase family enzyme
MPTMAAEQVWIRRTELARTNFPELRDRILSGEPAEAEWRCRTYPGYPRWRLDRVRPRAWPPLDRVLRARRCVRALQAELPPRRTLSRLLRLGHGIFASENRGPVPSAGGLQALELYLVVLEASWLPSGLYHYDRAGHHLSQVAAGAERAAWGERVPTLAQVAGGALLFVVVGDGARVAAKYGERGSRFLLLEAGHLMQNLCLLSTSVGLATVPLGGYYEREISREFLLPATDRVLYLAVCGQPQ